MKKPIWKLSLIATGCAAVSFVAVSAEDFSSMKPNIAAAQVELEIKNHENSSKEIENIEQKIYEIEEESSKNTEETSKEEGVAAASIDSTNDDTEKIEKLKESAEKEKLEKNISSFYLESGDEIVSKQTGAVDYQSYRMNCNIAVRDGYMNYLNAASEEIKEKLAEEEAKLSKGYTTGIETESLSAQLASLEAQKYTAQRQKELLLNQLEENGGSYDGFEITVDLSVLDADYYQNFLSSSTKKKEYENQIRVFGEYIQTPHQDNDKVELQMQLAQLQLADYESQLNMYVTEMITTYDTKKNESDAKQKEIEVQMKKLNAVQKLYDKGKVTKASIAEAATNLEKLKYEQIQMAEAANLSRCILDNQIEGQTIQQ